MRRLPGAHMVRALRHRNYRLWAGGALISNVGTWMQRTAQDWLVLTQLTHHNATAVGIVTALQFGPQMLCLPWTGSAADRFDRRKLLLATQAVMGLLALALGVLTITGLVQLWQVYAFAFLLGVATAFDAPARQSFVGDLVAEDDLANAVGLNSTSFNLARMVGPAVAGAVIAAAGTGWAFMANGASYGVVIVSLYLVRVVDLHGRKRQGVAHGGLAEGLRYVWRRRDLRAIMMMLFFMGTFGLNFPIFISTMCVRVFHADAGGYGLLTSLMAVGSTAGALLAAGRARPRADLLFVGAGVFGGGLALAAIMPGFWPFAACLAVVGVAAQTFTTTVVSTVQLNTDPAMRGRVMAIVLAIALGCTPLGSPLVGYVADRAGPRWALAIGASAGVIACLIGVSLSLSQRTNGQKFFASFFQKRRAVLALPKAKSR
jgi:MFS family permease